MEYALNNQKCLVIGGFGFLGHRLAEVLFANSCCVSLFSPENEKEVNPEIRCFRGSILNYDDLLKACEGIDVVFHVASIIFPYRFMPHQVRKNIFSINVEGTENVIHACIQSGVKRLVYTSSNTIVFDHEIINGDESLPYAAEIKDIYTQTKMIAEKKVLKANGQSGLLTCAIRPGGIYGPGDKLILHRVVQSLKKGYLLFTIGCRKVVGDSVYIDNVVHAHLLAAANLAKNSPVAGQAYFISDGEPSNYFEFLKPIIQGLGYKYPRFSIPYAVAYAYAFAGEWLYSVFNTPKPFLTMMEVKKLSVSNYFSIQKAKQDFGYIPLVSQKEGIEKSLPYCLELLSKIPVVERPVFYWWLSILGGMTILGLLAFHQAAGNYWKEYIPMIPVFFLRVLFFLAIFTHACEAFYALKLAKKSGLKETSFGWFLQTFLLGYPSLKLLLRQLKEKGEAFD